jgi:hypothetical protein
MSNIKSRIAKLEKETTRNAKLMTWEDMIKGDFRNYLGGQAAFEADWKAWIEEKDLERPAEDRQDWPVGPTEFGAD